MSPKDLAKKRARRQKVAAGLVTAAAFGGLSSAASAGAEAGASTRIMAMTTKLFARYSDTTAGPSGIGPDYYSAKSFTGSGIDLQTSSVLNGPTPHAHSMNSQGGGFSAA